MDFTLNILDKDGVALDVSNLTVKSDAVSVSDVITQNIAGMTLGAGNTYDIVFPADVTTDPLSVSAITFAEDAALNFNLVAGELLAGVTKSITIGATPITNFDIGVLTGGGVDTYDATVLVTGEDITITIDGNVTTGANIATETIADDDTIEISVVSAGYHTYTNTVRVYDYDVDVDIKLIANVTNPLDAEYRKPYPFFFTILEPCSYNVHIYNAQSANFGDISYYHSADEANTFATTPNAVFDTCLPDVVSITQRIIVHTVASSCGSVPAMLWDETFTVNGITTTEYKPYIVLDKAFNCCETIDTAIVVEPQELEMYNTGIHACDLTAIPTSLTYTMVDPEGTSTVLATYTGTQVDAGVLTALGFSYTPTLLGTHELTVSITSCCLTVEQVYTFDACSSWTVTNTECNIIEIANLSATDEITFTLKELSNFASFETVSINDIAQENIVVSPGTVTKLDMQVDNLYTVNVTDGIANTLDGDYIFVLDCNIKKCKKQLLLDWLCSGTAECDALAQSKLQDSWLKFTSLEDIVYQKWDDWKQQQSIFNTLSINDIMEDVITLGKALDVMNSICGSCGITNDCSCESRYTCSYTLTNAGYLVPTRYASIIVPNNGTDCGCS